ncbi:MAG: hypothetical protein ACRDTM_13210 [Micromonosporaceae bacterium]
MKKWFRRAGVAALSAILISGMLSALAPASAMASVSSLGPGDDATIATEPQFSSVCSSNDVHCQNGERIYPPPGYDPGGADWCWWDTHVKMCIKFVGDYVYVKDKYSDGRSAVGEVHGPENTYPWDMVQRLCRNRYGTGTWVKCNFNWPENNCWTIKAHTFNAENNDWIERFRKSGVCD